VLTGGRLRFGAAAATPHRELRGDISARRESDMRAEIERLVEEIKQSVGLLRRHL
jgi:hypothetical protein